MKNLTIGIIALVVVVAGFLIFNSSSVSGIHVDMYKSPTCGCCVGNAGVLKQGGYEVNVIPTDDINSIKLKYNIPSEMQSCHTSVVSGYFVEGHVPNEAIEKLLSEKPEVDGIALPGMPSGSAGMPGYKNGEFVIYAIKDGKYSEFMRI